MYIKIDNRETELLKSINEIMTDIEVKTECLPIGDVIICDENEEVVIIERKTINDLLSSIKDGRYEEQSYRLNGNNIHNHNIIYLIEGSIYKGHKDRQMLFSSMFSLNYYKGFSVMRTNSTEESAQIICNMVKKIIKGKLANRTPYYKNSNADNQTDEQKNDTNDKDYVNVVKKVKKENITTENINEIMLCQIPGVSSTTAVAIMEKFKSMSNLIKNIETDDQCMNDVMYTNTKGQMRKINKTSITNIIKYLRADQNV